MARPLPPFVIDVVRCPVCSLPFACDGSAVRCASGHSFDVAREGYLNLSAGTSRHTGDTADMLEHRAALHAAGHFERVREELADTVAALHPRIVLDVGAGNGYYTAGVLDAAPDAHALTLDASKAAAKRSAGAHDRIAALVADAWATIPLADSSVSTVITVFAPRNPSEFARMLEPGGNAVVVHAAADHLEQLRAPLGLLGIDADKSARLERAFTDAGFAPRPSHDVVYRRSFTPEDAAHAALMGPSSFHADTESLSAALDALPDPLEVTIAVRISAFSFGM